ncbi:MAG: hypothetical protein CO184_00250 [Candidatus Zambryskibacteria bacterium CG_4_9_14_3_um_filter_40_16]|uniref:Oxidoreductase n=2 Tax=Candidatus Zambryskiibacteriota TaxID=1817925 RepID=A0A2M7WV80_9BACT|nr:MAG: hypothetical protein CO184_00250 [Candidatus Zambryskibacteria bacterium CG_4_9_14_3_um_filter_40_16]
MDKLKNKTIIVVGASGGIGSALSRVFYGEGANVVLSARTEDKLVALAKTLGDDRTLVVPADATNIDSIRSVFKIAVNKFKHIDAVIITAGTWDRLSHENTCEEAVEKLDKHYKAILTPTFVVSFVAQEFFKNQGFGLIANISSHAAIRPELPGNLSYGPAKAAARHFMLALRSELKGTGIRVTDIQPAIVNTPDNSSMLNTDEKRKQAVQPETIAQWIVENFDNKDIPAEKLFDSNVVL